MFICLACTRNLCLNRSSLSPPEAKVHFTEKTHVKCCLGKPFCLSMTNAFPSSIIITNIRSQKDGKTQRHTDRKTYIYMHAYTYRRGAAWADAQQILNMMICQEKPPFILDQRTLMMPNINHRGHLCEH